MKTIANNSDLAEPANLSPEGKKAYKAIMAFLNDRAMTFTGGCKAFYSPQEWQERGEQYGEGSELIVVHDGGDLSYLFNLDHGYYILAESMNNAIEKTGCYPEGMTCWATAIYKL